MWLAGMLTACGLGFGPADSGAPADDTPKVSEARIRITPVDGARDVEADDPFTVEAEDGRLTSVHVEDGDGEAVEGVFTADRSRWHPRSRLSLSEKYTVDAVAEDMGAGAPPSTRCSPPSSPRTP